MKTPLFILFCLFISATLDASSLLLPKEEQQILAIEERLKQKWPSPALNTPAKPCLLLISGFQGAGKTTLLQQLATKHPQLLILSSDEIRYHLLHAPETECCASHYTDLIFHRLLKAALSHHYSIAIDANAHTMRTQEIEYVAKETGVANDYQWVKICLQASLETLLQRVKERQPIPEHYQGTINELLQCWNEYDTKTPDYDLMLNTDGLAPAEKIEQIEQFLKDREIFK
jgi:predicted kinase